MVATDDSGTSDGLLSTMATIHQCLLNIGAHPYGPWRLWIFCIMKNDRRILLFLILASYSFFLWSLAPSVLWGDEAFFQRSAFDGTLPRDGGGHWLWFVLARVIVQVPLGEVAYRVNLLSGLAAVATI